MEQNSNPADDLKLVEKEWSGYSYEELKFQLLLTRTRIEINKNMMMAHSQMLMHKKSRPISIFSRALGALDYLDYGIIAYKMVRKLYALFRK